MRKLPTVLAAGFIIITLWRVGQFAEARMVAGWLGWIFASVLGAALYVASYWTRDSISAKEVVKDGKTIDKQDRRAVNVKHWAIGVMVLLILVDGLFNVAEVWQSVNPPAFGVNPLLVIATATYGAFPTLIVALLGALQGHIDRLPKPPKPANKAQQDETESITHATKRLILVTIATMTRNAEKRADTKAQQDGNKALLKQLTGAKLKVYEVATRYPDDSKTQLAKRAGLSRQLVTKYLNDPTVTELLAHSNGHTQGKAG